MRSRRISVFSSFIPKSCGISEKAARRQGRVMEATQDKFLSTAGSKAGEGVYSKVQAHVMLKVVA
jgi:hypothetical protein